ncbi:PD-(D/E)XK nuclease family protein [Sulfitobacter aestuariivivens]
MAGELGKDQDTALHFGSLVHLLLEKLADLSPDQREHTAADLANPDESPGFAHALKEAKSVLDAPALQSIFDAGALAEVPVTASIGGQRLHGTIDRLLAGEKKIIAVDYKTNRMVPKMPETCPEGILRQMGAYAHMLAQIYPTHEIETAILWTATQDLMVLPHDIVTAALWRSPHLDGTDRHS